MTNPTEAPMANAIDDVKTGEIPMGAIENGRAHIDRLEHNYDFVGEAGPLGNCSDWHELIRCFEYMANCFTASPAPSQHTGWSDEAVERIWSGTFVSHPYTRGDTWVPQKRAIAAIRAALNAASSIAPATGFEVSEQFKAGYEEGFRDGSNAVRTAGVGPEGGADQVDEIFSWLEKQAKESRTGISFDWVPACDGDPSGWRFMRRHFISNAKKSLRQAVMAAMEYNVGKSFK